MILFLAANPGQSHPSKLAEECAEIERELRMTLNRDDFRFESRWAVGIDDLMRHLTEIDPTVIHFCGQSGADAGLILQDARGCAQPVSPEALAEIVDATAFHARVVVLNACFTTEQALALRSKVDCVVGMNSALGDVAARAFAIRFYYALGSRRSVGNAVDQGAAALKAKQLPDEVLPRCLTRDGLDAHEVFLSPTYAWHLTSSAPVRAQPVERYARVEDAAWETRLRSPLGVSAASRAASLLCEMHRWLYAGYAADAVLCAATMIERALETLAGAPLEALVADALWLAQRQRAVYHFAGQICGELDADGRRACTIAVRCALAAQLITETEVATCQGVAMWQASTSTPNGVLTLDRKAHRAALDELLDKPARVLVTLVHGEVDQGHDHFAKVMTWRLRGAALGHWRELSIKWPDRSDALGVRLARLLEELAASFGVMLPAPAGDPSTPDSLDAWVSALNPVIAAIDASRERLLLHHVLHEIDTSPGNDAALVDAYLRMIWSRVATQFGERVLVCFNLRRIERRGFPMSRAWRISRKERAIVRAVEAALERHHVPVGGLFTVVPELTSIEVSDLVDWLRKRKARTRDTAEDQARHLVSSTRGGRFDLVVDRLKALEFHTDRNSK